MLYKVQVLIEVEASSKTAAEEKVEEVLNEGVDHSFISDYEIEEFYSENLEEDEQ